MSGAGGSRPPGEIKMNAPAIAPPLLSGPNTVAPRAGAAGTLLRVARILVPTDFSEESKAALRYALRFAEGFGASIHLAYVIQSLTELKEAQVVPWNATSADATLVLQRKLAE